MSTCVRDKNNPNVFDYASGILDVMQEKLPSESVEPKVLGMYVELAIATTPGLERGRGDGSFVPDIRENNVMRMLARLRPDVVNIRQLVKMKIEEEEYGKLPTRVRRRREDHRPLGVPGTGLDDLAAVLRGLVGACDRILAVAGLGGDGNRRVRFSAGMGEKEWGEYAAEVRGQKRKLTAFLSKMVGPPPPGPRSEVGAAAPARRATGVYGPEEFGIDEEISDEEAQKSVPGKRKVYRALKDGVGEYEKLPKKLTKRSIRQEREEKRLEKIRGQFPPSMLKPLPVKSSRDGYSRVRNTVGATEADGEKQKTSALVQKGWGSGFDRMAEREGATGHKGDFVEI